MRASKAFSLAGFDKIARRDESDFADMGTVVSMGAGEGNTYTFKDNGSNVLAVAHLDTVQSDTYSSIINVKGEQVLLSPRLDDRLGVYIITRLLPAMGITCDWLLTTGEEVGQSSAEIFTPEKSYNWAFSFDRMGTDVVLYHYESKPLKKVLRKSGFRIGQGSFSVLSFLDAGCAGINFGCGYQDCHSLHAYTFLNDTFSMVQAFARFYRLHAGERLPYNGKRPHYGNRYTSNALPAYYRGLGTIDDPWSDYHEGETARSVYGSGYGVVTGSATEEGTNLDDLNSEDWQRVNDQILDDLRKEGRGA
jgi:hypothetical protein